MTVKSMGFAVATLMIGSAVLAREQVQDSSERRVAPAQSVTVTGCIYKESDYREANRFFNPLGVGDEFVLADASMANASAAASAAPGSASATATGTSGTAATYELTGDNEEQVAQFVGKRVEVSGMLKEQEVGTSGKPTGGPSAGVTADLKLRELDVTAVKAAASGAPCAPLAK